MTRARRILLVVALAACGTGKPWGGDMSAAMDMASDAAAICTADAGGPTKPTTCGSSTCPAGMICLVITPGIPPDAGGTNSYSCVAMPSACGCAPGCSIPGGPAGCFSSLCIGGEQCAFDGATLTCFGI